MRYRVSTPLSCLLSDKLVEFDQGPVEPTGRAILVTGDFKGHCLGSLKKGDQLAPSGIDFVPAACLGSLKKGDQLADGS